MIFCKSCEKGLGWGLLISTLVLLSLALTTKAQTFQYSRGWTNGKRSGLGLGYGGAPSVGAFELEAAGLDPLDVIVPSGRLQMSLSPSGRFRAGEHPQYLVKRSVGVPGKPVWFGKVFDEETSSAGRTGSPDSTHMRNSHAAGPDV